MFNKTTPLIKRFKDRSFTASATATYISPVQLGEQRIQIHIQPQTNACVIKFNEDDTNGISVSSGGVYIIEGYNGPLYITGSGPVACFEGVI